MRNTIMKLVITAALMLVSSQTVFAARFNFGVNYGLRTVAAENVKSVYGNGTVYYPNVSIRVWQGFFLGLGYEGGYKGDGVIGIYKEETTLEVSGFEAFVGYQASLGRFSPYVKVGVGSYAYKQEVKSLYVSEFKVDHKTTAWSAALGLKVQLMKSLFLLAEAKYIPMKVKPFDDEINLGGYRLMGGIGLAI